MAIARAVCNSKSCFKSLGLDENEISENGVDSLKVRHIKLQFLIYICKRLFLSLQQLWPGPPHSACCWYAYARPKVWKRSLAADHGTRKTRLGVIQGIKLQQVMPLQDTLQESGLTATLQSLENNEADGADDDDEDSDAEDQEKELTAAFAKAGIS